MAKNLLPGGRIKIQIFYFTFCVLFYTLIYHVFEFSFFFFKLEIRKVKRYGSSVSSNWEQKIIELLNFTLSKGIDVSLFFFFLRWFKIYALIYCWFYNSNPSFPCIPSTSCMEALHVWRVIILPTMASGYECISWSMDHLNFL